MSINATGAEPGGLSGKTPHAHANRRALLNSQGETMKHKPTFWKVFVDEQPKGQAYKSHKRWIWLRPNGGKETYGPGATIEDVRDHIARLCNVWGNAVEFRKADLRASARG